MLRLARLLGTKVKGRYDKAVRMYHGQQHMEELLRLRADTESAARACLIWPIFGVVCLLCACYWGHGGAGDLTREVRVWLREFWGNLLEEVVGYQVWSARSVPGWRGLGVYLVGGGEGEGEELNREDRLMEE